MITFDEAVPRIMAATTFSELMDENRPLSAYRKWVKIVHPDTVGAPRRATATQACAKLSELYHGRDRTWITGDIADFFESDGDVLLKVPRDPADNDLMATEADALRKLRQSGDLRFQAYAPRLIDTFLHEDGQRRRRHVNVIKRQKDMTSLDKITQVSVEDGIWIWRRLLVALGWAHRTGVIHGAVLEPHILINQRDRGLVLVDWCYAGHRPKAIVGARESAYPPEVLTEKIASPATDIYMSAGVMTRVLGERMPQRLRNFAAGCSFDRENMRPRDAWELLAEFDAIIPQRYRN
ncbi:serine/threonine protein kinase [Actinoplanes sp. NPDC051861]|uniref:serine/threonine protein kinase n=1 Tax=Actinoplanes sp. NPDC051861 TaxID=3155170 RepID=UPI00343D8F9E